MCAEDSPAEGTPVVSQTLHEKVLRGKGRGWGGCLLPLVHGGPPAVASRVRVCAVAGGCTSSPIRALGTCAAVGKDPCLCRLEPSPPVPPEVVPICAPVLGTRRRWLQPDLEEKEGDGGGGRGAVEVEEEAQEVAAAGGGRGARGWRQRVEEKGRPGGGG